MRIESLVCKLQALKNVYLLELEGYQPRQLQRWHPIKDLKDLKEKKKEEFLECSIERSESIECYVSVCQNCQMPLTESGKYNCFCLEFGMLYNNEQSERKKELSNLYMIHCYWIIKFFTC